MAKAVLDHSETEKNPQTWLMLGWAFVFFFEVVSRPQREENRLLRLLQERDISCVRRLTPVSVRAATCKNRTTQSGLKHTKMRHRQQSVCPHVASRFDKTCGIFYTEYYEHKELSG